MGNKKSKSVGVPIEQLPDLSTEISVVQNVDETFELVRGNGEYNSTIKICMVGDKNVGKTSLFLRLSRNRFESRYVPTVGLEFQVAFVKSNRNHVSKLQLWDIGGDIRYNLMVNSYYRGAGIIIMVFDLSNGQSLKQLINDQKHLREYESHGAKFVLVGNKSDLDRTVDESDLKLISHDTYIEVSLKDQTGVPELINALGQISCRSVIKFKNKIE